MPRRVSMALTPGVRANPALFAGAGLPPLTQGEVLLTEKETAAKAGTDDRDSF